MGGGGGGSRSIGDIEALVEKAKKELKQGDKAGRRNIFISFAMEDELTVNALRATARNPRSPLEFNDWSVSEPINSDRAAYIKQRISDRISQSSVTVVFLSNSTPNSAWVGWEIEESIRQGKHVLGVYPQDAMPASLPAAMNRYGIKCVRWAELSDEISKLE